MSIKYIIADDHAIFRQGLKYSLSYDADLVCIGEAGNGQQLMQQLLTAQPDVVLLDLKMPVMDGVNAATQIKEKYPEIKILVLTMHDDEQYIIHMLDLGANGYLVKNAEPEEIVTAMHTVVENEYYFSDLVSKTMLRNLVQKRQVNVKFEKQVVLNDRENEVLKLICKEYTTAEIADKIFLSSRTIEGIRAGMLEKIGVRNTAGLVLYAVKTGLAE